jgi:hypothetical protein
MHWSRRRDWGKREAGSGKKRSTRETLNAFVADAFLFFFLFISSLSQAFFVQSLPTTRMPDNSFFLRHRGAPQTSLGGVENLTAGAQVFVS